MTAKQVAYLTMADASEYVTDYQPSLDPMAALGWTVEEVEWRSSVDWNRFDAVYVCAPWDYTEHMDEFKTVLAAIDESRAMLCNDLSIILWNLEKTYLCDIEARGDDIIPSAWYDGFDADDMPGFFNEHGTERVVIKPIVGANARDTFVLSDPVDAETTRTLAKAYAGRKFFVQPFMENVQTEGEYSLFFFNGAYSHAVLKTPKAGDFRVQEEHGADINVAQPSPELLRVAHAVFSHIEPLPVYGRGDWVRGPDGRFLLMELELIEPSLYLSTDSGAAARFAAALDQRFQEFSRK